MNELIGEGSLMMTIMGGCLLVVLIALFVFMLLIFCGYIITLWCEARDE